MVVHGVGALMHAGLHECRNEIEDVIAEGDDKVVVI